MVLSWKFSHVDPLNVGGTPLMHSMLYEVRNVCAWFSQFFHCNWNPPNTRVIICRRIAANRRVSSKLEQALDHFWPLLLDCKDQRQVIPTGLQIDVRTPPYQ